MPDKKPGPQLSIKHAQAPLLVRPAGIEAQLVDVPNGGELILYLSKPIDGRTPLTHPPASIRPGTLILAIPPEQAAAVRAGLNPQPAPRPRPT